jgi:hypothetical protein
MNFVIKALPYILGVVALTSVIYLLTKDESKDESKGDIKDVNESKGDIKDVNESKGAYSVNASYPRGNLTKARGYICDYCHVDQYCEQHYDPLVQSFPGGVREGMAYYTSSDPCMCCSKSYARRHQ